MTDSDSDNDLKTDDDDTPPPIQGKTRNSMDETEEQLAQLQNPTSPSPRPPPTDPPPPVPPSNNGNDNGMLLNLENLDKKSSNSSNNYASNARRSLRRRRASLPSINILPSFKSLKSVMGFGIDEDEKPKDNTKEEKEKEKEKEKGKDKHSHDKDKPSKNRKRDNDKTTDNKIEHKTEKSNDKNKTLNKKLNPKEIKQLYIKNLKLQAQIDKYREREKEFEYKLSENIELVTELKNQVNAKSEVVKKLDEQLSKRTNDSDSLKRKLQDLERLLVEKDTKIQTLQQNMLKIDKNISKSNTLTTNYDSKKNGNLSPSRDDPLPTDKYGNKNHSRSLTPGGYALDAMSWEMQQTDGKIDDDRDINPSAPPIDDEFLDDKIHGLSLDQKLSQRSSWKELQSRGILLDDPTTKKSSSLQEAHRTLHKRKASQKLDKFFANRPNMKKLHDTNILKNVEIDDDNEQKVPIGIKVDNGLDLNQKIKQRPSWKELNSRGILLDDPTGKKSHSLQAAHRQLHKRKASNTIDKLLINRPTPNELHEQNIIDANTAALFFGASPTTEVVTPRTDYMDMDEYTQMMDATDKLYAASQPAEHRSNPKDDIIYKDNINKPETSSKLERNLKQRPSIEETMARGILMFRTDTKLNYDLQERHKQLHKRKASENLEKLMLNRPESDDLEEKGILIFDSSEHEKHKRKASADLEAGLKRRMSISEMQGLGLLFQDHGYEYDNLSDPEQAFITDSEQNKNVASFFKQPPRTSKPLHETDFKGVEFDDFTNDCKSQETILNKRRGSIDNAEEFEPFKLSKKEKISRIASKLKQRSSVEEMRMRGLLYEHPSISKSLVERKRDLMKRRASNKVESLLMSRPNRKELENKNILLSEDETLEKRKRHKRKRSQNLENSLVHRPKLMEKEEAQRQRRRSMDDNDFTPDYLSHIFNDDEEEDMYNGDLQQIEIRFLNIGGFVIPLVSPKFMGDLAGGMGGGPMGGGPMGGGPMDDFDDNNNNKNEEEMEQLREELDDIKMQMIEKDAIIKQKDVKITSLKGENSSLKQNFSRKSLVDLNHLNTLKMDRDRNMEVDNNNKTEIIKLQKQIERNDKYICQLRYYMKEEKGINIPTVKELKKRKLVRNKLKNHFKQRASFTDLQDKQILIADRKLQFGRNSKLISNFLARRPSRESLEEYFKDSLDYNEYVSQQKENEENIRYIGSNVDIVDNATKNELREEVVRLNNKLAEKIGINNKLEKENETMRFKIEEKLNENIEILSRNLKAHSINENTVIEEAIIEVDEENRKIKQLKGENDELKQKIRRLSTVDAMSSIKINNIHNISEMKQFVNWSKQLKWPNIILNIYEENNNLNDFLLMKKVINESQNNNKNEREKLLFEIEKLTIQINKINESNNNKMIALQQILEKQRIEHLKDKEKLISNAMKELDRMRAEIKKVGKVQQIIHQQNENNNNNNNNSSYYSYVSSATQYFWNKK